MSPPCFTAMAALLLASALFLAPGVHGSAAHIYDRNRTAVDRADGKNTSWIVKFKPNVTLDQMFSFCDFNPNGTRPDYNGTMPLPDYNGTRPDNNGTRPDYNGTRPDNNGTRPGYNGTRPDYNGTMPDVTINDTLRDPPHNGTGPGGSMRPPVPPGGGPGGRPPPPVWAGEGLPSRSLLERVRNFFFPAPRQLAEEGPPGAKRKMMKCKAKMKRGGLNTTELSRARVLAVDEEDVEGMAAMYGDDLIEYIEPDYKMTAAQDMTSAPGWALDRLDAAPGERPLNQAFTLPPGLNGSGVHIFVLDTGVRHNHSEFRDERNASRSRVMPGADMLAPDDNTSMTSDCGTGHGTASASAPPSAALHSSSLVEDNS